MGLEKIYLFSILCVSVFNASANSDNVNASSMTDLASRTQKILSFLPGSTSKALSVYLDIVNPSEYKNDSDIRQANKGVIGHFGKVFSRESSRGRCLYTKAALLYRYIAKVDEANIRPVNKINKISLDDTTEKTSLDPGWLWNAAMKIAGNNANEAFELLGVCGHDDSGERENAFRYALGILDEDILKKAGIKYIPSNSNSRFYCPDQRSVFFVPGSLGKNVDIPTKLKQKIAKIQAPNLGQEVIPAKYYHVFGGAYMACKLIQAGIGKTDAKDYTSKFVSAYRRARLCTSAGEMKHKFDEVNTNYQKALAKNLSDGKDGITMAEYLSINRLDCYNLSLTSLKSKSEICGGSKNAKEILEKVIDRALAGKVYFEQQNCPTSSAGQFSDGFRVLSSTGKSAFSFNNEFNCINISTSNCAGAKNVLETWNVDFEWTIEQQLAGAKFASEYCKDDEKKQDQDQKCEIPSEFVSLYSDSFNTSRVKTVTGEKLIQSK
ncbi:MAG: hypothetical protein L6Q37_06220 [Bdellovibrionaceae bacterium]|nr:hypothetical protein [Pseudobdellovibrionaceae bacterium]